MQLGVVPAEAVAVAVLLEQLELGDPVELAHAFHGVAGEAVEDALPPAEDVVGLLVRALARHELLGEAEVLPLKLESRDGAAVLELDVTDPDHPITLPEKPALEGLEDKWNARWEAEGTYRFDRERTRAEVYSIDTPPPTVSG